MSTQPPVHRDAAPAKVRFNQFIVIVSIFLAASALSLTGGFISLFDSDTSHGPVMIVGSIGLLLADIITAVVFGIWNNRTRHAHDD